MEDRNAWRFIDTGPAPGSRQMAMDESLLEAVASGRSRPVLRLFAFQPACLSLGRFQASPAFQANSLDSVRRPTGGSAVLHSGDLCYAVVAPVNDPMVGRGLRRTYRRIGLAFARALALLGAIPDEIREPLPDAHSRTASRLSACFAVAGPYELTVGGVKVLGSAQMRRRGAFLQQGSLRLAADQEREVLLLGRTQPALSDLLGWPVPYMEAAAAIRRAFAQKFGIAFIDDGLSRDEERCAASLEETRYSR